MVVRPGHDDTRTTRAKTIKGAALFTAASLLLSPIVWLHFLALLLVPSRSSFGSFGAAWQIPLPTAVGPERSAATVSPASGRSRVAATEAEEMQFRAAAAKIVPPVALIVVPVIAFVLMFRIAYGDGSFGIDFHNEIYPEAQELLKGQDPFPAPTADLTHGSNHIWPPLVGYMAAPLTVLSPAAADVVIVILGLACFGAALWTVGVRDWRVYGASSLWAPVIGEMRTAHLSLILCFLVAIVWRTRARTAIAGLTLGLAIGLKFFVWPLILWLASMRRWREAGIAAATAAASLLLLLPFTGILEYARLLRRLGAAFDQDGFTPYGVLVQAGAPSPVARVVALAIGTALLAVAWRRRSFALIVAAALLLSPIVWLDYFALTAIPLAVVRPSFSWVWLVPILTFGIPSSGAGIGVPTQSIWVLGVFAVVVWYTERRERALSGVAAPRFEADVRQAADS